MTDSKRAAQMVGAQKLSDLQIAVRIVPKRVRWPDENSSPVWAAAHRCVRAFEDLVRDIDNRCLLAEQDKQLPLNDMRRRRDEICAAALRKLETFKPFETAVKVLSENADALEKLSDRDPAQVQALQKLKQAIGDLQEGIEATRRTVLDRSRNGSTAANRYVRC